MDRRGFIGLLGGFLATEAWLPKIALPGPIEEATMVVAQDFDALTACLMRAYPPAAFPIELESPFLSELAAP